jgi:hypothetical protein
MIGIEKIQVTIHNLFKEVPKVPLVIRGHSIREGIQDNNLSRDSRTRSLRWKLRTVPGTPPEQREQRERTTQTVVEKIKILEHECIKMCDEGTHIWTELTNNPKLQALEEKIRTMQEQAHQATECVNTLPLTERMTTLLVNRKLYSAME